jgi:hypothetical protein
MMGVMGRVGTIGVLDAHEAVEGRVAAVDMRCERWTATRTITVDTFLLLSNLGDGVECFGTLYITVTHRMTAMLTSVQGRGSWDAGTH